MEKIIIQLGCRTILFEIKIEQNVNERPYPSRDTMTCCQFTICKFICLLRIEFIRYKSTSHSHILRAHDRVIPFDVFHSICGIIGKIHCSRKLRKRNQALMRQMDTHRYLSWTFCLISAKFSDVISRSKYSDSFSVADSKSFWFASNISDWLFFRR